MSMLLGGCIGFCGGPVGGGTEASIYVNDSATGTPVHAPRFVEQGVAIGADCREPDAKDPTLCTYDLLQLAPGVHTITVAADGYADQVVTIDTSTTDSVHLSVEMQHAE